MLVFVRSIIVFYVIRVRWVFFELLVRMWVEVGLLLLIMILLFFELDRVFLMD